MANDYYTPSGDPATNTRGISSVIRAVFTAIETGFGKLAGLTGNGGKLIRVNSGATAQEAMSLGTANQVLGMNSGATGYEHKTISGTSNQVTATHGVGTITLSTPQDIGTGSSPTFNGITLTSATIAGVNLATSASSMRAALGVAIGSDVQPYDADLAAVAGLSSTGMIARTGSDTWATRTITAGSGCTVTNGDGVAGNPTIGVSPGVGLGDVLGTAVSVAGEIFVAADSSGKQLARATQTGLLKATSGVLAAVVSGTDIKTINSQSLLGSGDITITSAWIVKTANYTAVSGDRILANTSGGVFTVTLPATPATGDYVEIADGGGSFAANNLTVARNGSTIMALSEDMTFSTDNIGAGFAYNGSTWRIF